MGYIGNASGPKKSELLIHLGHKYFGITIGKLKEDIYENRKDEDEGIVDEVHVDKNGEPYINLIVPERNLIKKAWNKLRGKSTKKIAKFFFQRHGFKLEGDILTYTESEKLRWNLNQNKK
ncbi:hypothetical protein JXJ21_23740 [candidate division KSB1 bacterium]|nr:hypothetical protein [candidate division KSB1 bacterium]